VRSRDDERSAGSSRRREGWWRELANAKSVTSHTRHRRAWRMITKRPFVIIRCSACTTLHETGALRLEYNVRTIYELLVPSELWPLGLTTCNTPSAHEASNFQVPPLIHRVCPPQLSHQRRRIVSILELQTAGRPNTAWQLRAAPL
jgi:hypothetical protein